jgi:predicted RNA-binding Zn-ribbon protein involved in translation (DUF1610 family)
MSQHVCGACNTIINPTDEDDVYGCDFCGSLLCDTCQLVRYKSYYKCDHCGVKYCYYDGPHTDHYCAENSRRGSGCGTCGN